MKKKVQKCMNNELKRIKITIKKFLVWSSGSSGLWTQNACTHSIALKKFTFATDLIRSLSPGFGIDWGRNSQNFDLALFNFCIGLFHSFCGW